MANMKRLRVLSDVDGVIADYRKEFIQRAKKILPGFKVPTDSAPDWDIAKELRLSPAFTELVYKQMNDEGVAARMPEMPGAVESVKELAKVADVYFVTSPTKTSKTWEHDRRAWLVDKFGEELGNKVVNTHHKYLVVGDVLIDDKPDHLREWSTKHPLGIALGYGPVAKAAMKKGSSYAADRYTPVADWPTVVELVKRFSKLGAS